VGVNGLGVESPLDAFEADGLDMPVLIEGFQEAATKDRKGIPAVV
jgi:hypothetical protein